MARRLKRAYEKSGHPPGKRRLVGRPDVVFFAYKFVMLGSFSICNGDSSALFLD